jgi:hypothetical protein
MYYLYDRHKRIKYFILDVADVETPIVEK